MSVLLSNLIDESGPISRLTLPMKAIRIPLSSAFFSLAGPLCLMPSLLGQTVISVKEGDSLWSISKRTGVSVAAIQQENGLTDDVIRKGMKLKVPVSSTRASLQRALPVSPAEGKRLSGRLSAKRMSVLLEQVLLDRAGFSPGKIDGLSGKFSRAARALCENWRPSALRSTLPATTVVTVPANWSQYVNTNLPGSGRAPDFRALTEKKEVIHYYSGLEYFAERYHCSESLLKELNPGYDFRKMKAGASIVVPNVEPFEIEKYFRSDGEGLWASGLGKGGSDYSIYISAPDLTLTVWKGSRLVRSYPITLNKEDSPRGQRELGVVAPGPTYLRKKTELDLLAGPNSPVGIVWCSLGDGFGIHGTNNPDTIGRATSSGCIRLANWDAVRVAALVRKGTKVVISARSQQYVP